MDKPIDLLQGTLDMLILKAVSLGPLHGDRVPLRIQQISKDRLEISRARSIRRCTGWSTRAGLPANGASLRTSVRPNITGSRRRASAHSRPKLKSGTAWHT